MAMLAMKWAKDKTGGELYNITVLISGWVEVL